MKKYSLYNPFFSFVVLMTIFLFVVVSFILSMFMNQYTPEIFETLPFIFILGGPLLFPIISTIIVCVQLFFLKIENPKVTAAWLWSLGLSFIWGILIFSFIIPDLNKAFNI